MQTPDGEELNSALFQGKNDLLQKSSDSSLDNEMLKPQLITRSSPSKQHQIEITHPKIGDIECEVDMSPIRQSGPTYMCPHVLCTYSFNEQLLKNVTKSGATKLEFCEKGCKFNFHQPLSKVLQTIQELLFTNQLQQIKNNKKIPKQSNKQKFQTPGKQNTETDHEYYKIGICKTKNCDFFFFQIEGINQYYCPSCLESYQL